MQSTITALLLGCAAAFSPKDAAAPLFAAQQAALAKIQAALPLDAKTYPADLGLDTFTTSNGGNGEMRSWEAPPLALAFAACPVAQYKDNTADPPYKQRLLPGTVRLPQ